MKRPAYLTVNGPEEATVPAKYLDYRERGIDDFWRQLGCQYRLDSVVKIGQLPGGGVSYAFISGREEPVLLAEWFHPSLWQSKEDDPSRLMVRPGASNLPGFACGNGVFNQRNAPEAWQRLEMPASREHEAWLD